MNAPVLGPILPPVRKSVTVPWSVDAAFRRFTAELASWWPLATHSVGQERAVTCRFEERVGGEIYEVRDDGERTVWGTVLVWEPPARVRFTWHPGRPGETHQEVELRFTAEASGTRLELAHSGWERAGREAKSARRAYNLGWIYVLDLYRGQRTFTVRALDLVIAIAKRFRRKPAATASA